MIAESEGGTESMAHPLAPGALPRTFSGLTVNPVGEGPATSADVAFSGLTVNAQEGDEVAAAEPYLAYLSELADAVGLIDPVEAYLRPLLADWGLLRQEADRLLSAATVAEAASGRLTDRLGALDAGWAGKHAVALVAYIRQIGVAGGDLADALNALAGALNELVTSLRHIVVDLVEVLVATAEVTSESAMLPIGGTGRARSQPEDAGRSAKALFEAGRDVLEAFRRLCDGVDDAGGAARALEVTTHYHPGALA